MTKIAIVVVRYGEEVVGGAETFVRRIARRFVNDLGWEVDVLTTCAKDYQTWKNSYASGTENDQGVTVRRFPTWFPRWQPFSFWSRALLSLRRRTSSIKWLQQTFESLWYIAQGPYAPGLTRYLRKYEKNYDHILLKTYLYHPSLAASKIAPHKTTLIPTAHDEPAFYLPQIAQLLHRVSHLLCLSKGEQELVESIIGETSKITMGGPGVEFTTGEAPLTRGKKSAPFLLYLGRISKGKGVDTLMHHFLSYLERNPTSPLELHLAGLADPGFTSKDPRIHMLGFVDDTTKTHLFDSCLAVVNPSPYESLSLVTLEAISRHKPVLVNSHCKVLNYYAEETRTVVSYGNKEEFHTHLEYLIATDWTNEQQRSLLKESKRWMESLYSWSSFFEKMKAILDKKAIDKKAIDKKGAL